MHAYSLSEYASMLVDRRRELYIEALARAITPGTTMLEIGGGTGFFSLIASRLGARKVYCLESNPVIEKAQRCAAHNGLENIEFLRGLSAELELPEKADLILHDLRGALPLFDGSVATLVDARQRHLAEGGRFLAARDTIHGALLEDPALFRSAIGPWHEGLDQLDLSAFIPTRVAPVKTTPTESARYWPSFLVRTLDYASIEDTPTYLETLVESDREGECHGIVLWFDCELCEGLEFSNAPEAPESRVSSCYETLWLPVTRPLPVARGQRLMVRVVFWKNCSHGPMEWEIGELTSSGEKHVLYQATSGMSGTSASALGDADRFEFGGSAKADLLAANRLRAGEPVGQVLRRLQEDYPEEFPDRRAARVRLAQLSHWFRLRPLEPPRSGTILTAWGTTVTLRSSDQELLGFLASRAGPFWASEDADANVETVHQFLFDRTESDGFSLLLDGRDLYDGSCREELEAEFQQALIELLRNCRSDLVLLPCALIRSSGRTTLVFQPEKVPAIEGEWLAQDWVLLDSEGSLTPYQVGGLAGSAETTASIDTVLVPGGPGAPTTLGQAALQIFQASRPGASLAEGVGAVVKALQGATLRVSRG